MARYDRLRPEHESTLCSVAAGFELRNPAACPESISARAVGLCIHEGSHFSGTDPGAQSSRPLTPNEPGYQA